MDNSHCVCIFTKGNINIKNILDVWKLFYQEFVYKKKRIHYFLAVELTWEDLGLSRHQLAASVHCFVGDAVSHGHRSKKLLYTR